MVNDEDVDKGMEGTETEFLDLGEEEDGIQALEIVFNPAFSSRHRRKSSIASTEAIPPRKIRRGSCFIHTLLDAHQAYEAQNAKSTNITAQHNLAEANKHPKEGDSRFLTKVQLSDLVLGIRELSKRFANMDLRLRVRSVMVVTKPYDKDLMLYTRRIAQWLLSPGQSDHYTVYVNSDLKDQEIFGYEEVLLEDPSLKDRLRFWTPEMCKKNPHAFDFVVTLGGDGTVLYASWLFQQIVPPVLAFALGSLGFLTKFDFRSYQQILERSMLQGITVSLRLRFEGTIMRSIPQNDGQERDLTLEILGPESDGHPTHRPAETFTILNEVVVDRGPNPVMSITELFGDDEHLTSILADGICIATPTGSTAYSLAAGGSLCHPEIPSMLISPICPHSLTFRSLMVPDSMVLRVGVPYDSRTTAWASFDGRQRVELHQGDYVTIVASRYPFPLIQNRKQNKDWFDSLSQNFNWGARQRQKAFSI